MGYVGGTPNTARVVYRDVGGGIIELSLVPGRPWFPTALSASVGAPQAAGNPMGYVTPDGTARVDYRDVNGNITELFLQPGQSWQQATLSALAQ